MKKLGLLVVVLCSVLLSGCFLKSTIKLTDEESKIIAENAAQLLLKYDKNYSGKLINPEDALELTVTPSGAASQSPSVTQTSPDNTAASATPTVTPTVTTDDVTILDSTDLSMLTGNGNIVMQCSGYQLYENYEVSNSVNIEPLMSGNQLMIVNIQLTNTTTEIQKINILESGLLFQLEVDNSGSYVPNQSILLNDLQYLNINIASEQKEEAILVFEVPADFKADKMNLSITKDAETIILKLK